MLLTDNDKKERLNRAFSGIRNVPEKLHRATQALFWEHRHACRAAQKGFTPVYNLSKRDHDDTLSMAQLYFQCSSEYEAGLILLGDWQHWEKLTACKWFKPHLLKWREEKARRESSMGRSKIIELAEQGNLAAAKYLDQSKLNEVQPTKEDSPVGETPVVNNNIKQEETDWIKRSLDLARGKTC